MSVFNIILKSIFMSGFYCSNIKQHSSYYFPFQVFFSVLVGAMQLGQAGPNFTDVATARGAAYKVFQIIDRVRILYQTFA